MNLENMLCEIEAYRSWFHGCDSLLVNAGTIIRSRAGSGAVFPINGRLRDELLNETLFTSLAQARVAIALWRADYKPRGRTPKSPGRPRPSSPAPSIRDGRSRCAMPKAPRQRPSLHPPSRAQPTPETNSKLDRNWGQRQPASA
ncbi:MAG: hypothetical protein EOQ80_26855 [Mesorhizobium sp.]|nr:MAG: hypothetical protein EOQ80_26855 [Mesorhizobium sp.]